MPEQGQTDQVQTVEGRVTRVSRRYPFPLALVFKAWTSAEHVSRWFTPAGLATPACNIDFRVGGAFEVCMRFPEGTEHWTRGAFAEIVPNARLVIDIWAEAADGGALFKAWTEVAFSEYQGGTLVEVEQTYSQVRPEALPMIGGSSQGWGSSLDLLGAEVSRIQAAHNVNRSVAHGVFSLERTYDAPVARVWRALTDIDAKAKWFNGPKDGNWVLVERYMDFRIGGRERAKGSWGGTTTSCFDATYFDIVPLKRIVYAYEMLMDEVKISVSLATLELEPAGEGRTRLKVTEQGAFLDGYDDNGSREGGTNQLLDMLGASLLD